MIYSLENLLEEFYVDFYCVITSGIVHTSWGK